MRAMWVIVLLTASCSSQWEPNPSRHYHVQISSAFSLDQSAAIMNAVLIWQQRSNDFVTFDGDSSATTDLIIIELVSEESITKEFGGGVIGVTEFIGESSRIDLTSTPDTTLFSQTVQHEIGHALGLKHTVPGTIMCATTQCASASVTCADVARVEEDGTYSCNNVN